jgi:hypothetical protein
LIFKSLLFLLAQATPETESMLYKAEWINKKYSFETAKLSPPTSVPQAEKCLEKASVWFTIDLAETPSPAFQTLNQDPLWEALNLIGVEGVYLKGLKKGGANRTGIGIDPKWGDEWNELSLAIQKRGAALIGDSIGSSLGISSDFALALKNVGNYPGLYHLIEIEHRDWKLLPEMGKNQFTANVPWLQLQELNKKGYVPEQCNPYVKMSSWNATPEIQCTDGKVRRWIYLKKNARDPVIDWLNPSFSASRLAAADILDSILNVGQKIVLFDGAIPQNANETLFLWARKLGAFSVLETTKDLYELKSSSSDLMNDIFTRPALLHALIAEDAEALKLMYRLFLNEGIETRRLVHTLQPFDSFACDWNEFLLNPRKKYSYFEEILTGEALRMRLIKEDAARIGEKTPSTWPFLCQNALGFKDFDKHREEIGNAHLLLSLFYAMQPGVFSFSASDLIGSFKQQTIDLMKPNEETLYASLPGQLQNPKSFAMQLRNILKARREQGVANGKLLAIPDTVNRGVLVLLHELKEGGKLQLLAVNFSKAPVSEVFDIPRVRKTTAIDLITGLAMKKPLDAETIRIDLPPLSGKAILFQTKYYD